MAENGPSLETQAREDTVASYEILKDPQQREVLKRRCIDLVHATQDVDTAVFLDKAARPLANLYRKVYSTLAPDKPLPKIQFVNIGYEKTYPLRNYYKNVLHQQFPESPQERVSVLNTTDDLCAVYGGDNVEQLRELLHASPSGNRLIVDDVVDQGITQALALKILGVADGDSSYSFFSFLESENDKSPFRLNTDGTAYMPWQLTDASLVDDYDFESIDESNGEGKKEYMAARDKSFTSVRNQDEQVRAGGEKIREELDSLAQEIIKEHKQQSI